ARSTYAQLTAPSRLRRRPAPPLPCLEDVLARYAASAFLDIELKVPGCEAATLALLRRYPPRRGHLLSSFYPAILAELRRLDAAAPLGFLADRPYALRQWPKVDAATVLPHFTL